MNEQSQKKRSLDSLIQSRFFWQGLKMALSNSPLPALVYNGLLTVISDAFSEDITQKKLEIQYTLSHSRMRALPASVCSLLKMALPIILRDGVLTSSQRAIISMMIQKLNEQN